MNNEFFLKTKLISDLNLAETVLYLKDEIVDRKHYEKTLEESKVQAEKAAESKNIFLANMSHEIRTPLGLILGFTEELINSSQLTPANRSLIHTIKSNSEILARLINDILDFSKIDSGKLDYNIAPIRVCDLIEDLKVICKELCTEKHLYFHKNILTALPEDIFSDQVRIKQVLMNLVGNAVKYSEQGGLILNISYSPANSLLSFDIIDSGVGIPHPLQSDIFQVFKQVHKDSPGAGLGLPLSRNLARGLEGDLKLMRSSPSQGSWFRVEFKNQKHLRSVPSLKSDIPPQPSRRPPDLSGWTVLVVDDLIDNVRLLDCILRPTRALVDLTTSSKQALEKVQGQTFDLILLDLMMPEMDGFKTLNQLRNLGFAGEVWAVSAHAMKDQIAESLQAGFSQHITKPIHRMDFYQKLEQLLQARRVV